MEDVFLPLVMKDTAFTLQDRFKERIVPVVMRDKTPGIFDPSLIEAMNFLANEEMELPAGGGVSPTAHGIYLFSEMLRRGGELNGARILSPETISSPRRTRPVPWSITSWTTCAKSTGCPSIPHTSG